MNQPTTRTAHDAATARMTAFLVQRLTEDLADLWQRDRDRRPGWTGPGLATQVAVVDELLTTLRSGLLPHRRELRMLLFGYGDHPDYDARWVRLIVGA